MLRLPPRNSHRVALARPVLDILCDVHVRAAELAAHWRTTEAHLANLRRAGKGPPYTKPLGAVLYPTSEVMAWELAGASAHVTLDRVLLWVAAAPGVSPADRERIAAHLRAVWASGRDA